MHWPSLKALAAVRNKHQKKALLVMRGLIRFLPGAVAGLVLGWLAAHYIVRQPPGPPPSGGTVASDSTQRLFFEKKSNARKAGVKDAEAWDSYLANALPHSEPENAATALAKIRALRQQAAQSNPVRAEVEREWLLVQVPTGEIAALAKDIEQWPNAGPAFSFLLPRWAAQDPKGALAFARGLPPGDARRGLEVVVSRWVESDPNAAITYLESSQDGFLKTEGLREGIRALAKTDPQGALARLEAIDPSKRSALLSEIVSSWGGQDGAAAVDWIQNQVSPEDARDALLRRATLTWSRNDPQETIECALDLPQSAIGNHELADMFKELAMRNPQAATDRFSSLPRERQSPEVAEEVAHGMALGKGMDHTLNPQEAVAWAERFPTGELRDASLAGLVKYGAANDIEFALSIVPRLPEGPIRAGAVGFLADLWGRKDAPKTAEWLDTLPPSPSRDEAVIHFGLSITANNAQLAARWLATIQDTEKRDRYSGEAFVKWRAQDAQGAEAWLGENSAFSEQLKAKLLKADRP